MAMGITVPVLSSTSMVVAEEAVSTSGSLVVFLLFGVAGVLFGGVYSAYKADNRVAFFVLAVMATIALVGAILWALGVIGV